MRRIKPPPNAAPFFEIAPVGKTQPRGGIVGYKQGQDKTPTPTARWGTWFSDLQKTVNQQALWITAGDTGTDLTASTYLDVNGVTMTSTLGIPLLRAGSITGVSARVSVDSYTPVATLSMEARIDNSKVFSADWTVSATGLYTWEATQDANIDTFTAGQQLQVYLTVTGTVQFDNPMAIIEVIV